MDNQLSRKNHTVFSVNDFNSLIFAVNKDLLDREPALITYNTTEDLSNNIAINDPVIAKEVGVGANIYAIWSRTSSDSWKVMYIGQRSKSKVIERIKQHLFQTPSGTQSKLEKVKELVKNNHHIGISTTLVTPDPLRLSVEDQLIYINTHNNNDLPWNNKSRQEPLFRT